MGDVEWKTEQVQFLLCKGFFYLQSKEQDPPVGGLLAGMQHTSVSVEVTSARYKLNCLSCPQIALTLSVTLSLKFLLQQFQSFQKLKLKL
jgi:hypothetical protein